MAETPVIRSIEPFIMFDLPETPIEPKSNTRPASPAFLAWATFSKAARVAASW
jgi:hypothetical protein